MAYNKHIIVLGSARSGTSWLAELLARPYRYRLLYEPEHEFNTPKGHLLCDRWMEDQTEAGSKAHTYLKKVFANRVDNDWIAQHSNRKWKRHLWPFIPKKFIIKFVRCNLGAIYLQEAFGIPVVHLVRNPLEVMHSQQRVQFPWLYDLSRFAAQPKLVTSVKETYGMDLTAWKELSTIEKVSLRWCLENRHTLDRTYTQKIKVLSYAELREDMELYKQLCETYQLEPVPNLASWYQRPSSKTHPKSTVRKGGEEQGLSTQDREVVLEMVKMFKLEQWIPEVGKE